MNKPTLVWLHYLFLFLIMISSTVAADTMAEEPGAQAQRQCEELKTSFEAAKKLLVDARIPNPSDEEKARFRASFRAVVADYAPRFLTLARQYPSTLAAVQALTWIVQIHNIDPALQAAALEILRVDYRRSTDTDDAIRACFWLSPPNCGEAFLQSVLEENPDRHSQMLACWQLAVMFNIDATHVQAEAYFERIISQYGNVPINKDFPNSTMVDAAQTALYQLRHLGIGQPAPDIVGSDVDGKEFKLSDYRGKVVALVFWGRWCVPCWEGIPHERALAERLKNRPFALLGVNSDSKERCQAALKEGNITWPNWWDGGNPTGPIATRWNGGGWPSSYVFDAQGVIRYKDVFGAELDAAVDGLLKEAEVSRQTSVPTVSGSDTAVPR